MKEDMTTKKMIKNRNVYPKCLAKDQPKGVYLTHDGYARPCCFFHRYNKIEKELPWLVADDTNVNHTKSLNKVFDKKEYQEFFQNLLDNNNVPEKCYEICGKDNAPNYDTRKEKYLNTDEKIFNNKVKVEYLEKYVVPKNIQLDVTHRCSLLCPRCARVTTIIDNEPAYRTMTKKDVSLEMIKTMINEHHFNFFDFTGSFGDCIYHPEFLEIIKLLKSKDIEIKFHTNGSRKSKEWWKQLYEVMDPEYDRIVFGVDGLKDTAHIYRVNIDFDSVVEAMTLGVKYGFKKNQWMYIVFKHNEHQVEQAKKFAQQIGIDFLIMKSHRWNGPNDPLMPSEKWLPESVIQEYQL
tara:strand:+ start:4007 stop:5053 length:1047 start_codon:yes stop_codon:yes gene_type:complete